MMLCSVESAPNIAIYGSELIALLQIYEYISNFEVQKLFSELHDLDIWPSVAGDWRP